MESINFLKTLPVEIQKLIFVLCPKILLTCWENYYLYFDAVREILTSKFSDDLKLLEKYKIRLDDIDMKVASHENYLLVQQRGKIWYFDDDLKFEILDVESYLDFDIAGTRFVIVCEEYTIYTYIDDWVGLGECNDYENWILKPDIKTEWKITHFPINGKFTEKNLNWEWIDESIMYF